jgi:nucleoside-diphosphate-sugar epimerase
MIVGVTGGSGFIGSWVCRELKARGHDALILDHKGRGEKTLLGDVRDETIVHELAAHVDGIIHLAAVLGTAETIDNPTPAAMTNIVGTLNVFEAASRYDLPVVYAAVGNSGIGRGTYCITKACGEEFVKMYREDRGLRVTAVRPMNAYGPGQSAPAPYGSSKVRKIVPSFVCSALSGAPMRLYGGGTQYSDTVYVGDVARVFVAALEAAQGGRVPNHPIDVGNRWPLRVIDVARTIADIIPGATLEDVPMRPGEPEGGPLSVPTAIDAITLQVTRHEPDLSTIAVRRAVKSLGTVVSADPDTLAFLDIDPDTFKPIRDGLEETVQWFRSNEGVTWRYPA